MPAPALSIPVRANLDAFKQQMNETSSLARTAARKVTQQFLDMNKEMAGGAASAAFSGMASSALKLTGQIALVIGAAKLMGDAIGAARDQIAKMVEIADKAASTDLSPEFWQSWMNGAKGAERQIELFEAALTHAFQALKPVLNPDWSVWDDGLTKMSAVERAMREMRELFTTDQDFSGFTLFRNSQNQDQKIIAVLTYMKQLQDIGQGIAALDLGEKLFGAAFIDRIRTGQESIDGLLNNMKIKSEDAFSSKTVERAKQIDDELKNAWRTLSQNLHPSLEALDNVVLSIKSGWVRIVELMAKAAELTNKIRPTNGPGPNSLVSAIDADEQTRLRNRLNDPGLTQIQRSGLEDQLRAVQARIAQAEANDVPMAPVDFSHGGTSAVPLPKRRPDDAPEPPKQPGASNVDRLETSVDVIEKRAAGLQKEAEAYDLGTAARERAKIEAQLMTVAMQANAAAGKGENVVTEEQRQRINEVADAYAKAAQEMEKAKVASQIKFGQQTAFMSQEDVQIAQQLRGLYPDVATALNSVEASAMRTNEALRGISSVASQQLTTGLADILDGTKSVSDGFRDMSRAIVRALEEALIKMLIVQPIMRSMQSLSGGIGGAGVGLPMNILPFDDGGYTGPGPKHMPKGVVHAGEVVWSQRDVARAGGVGVVEAMRKGYRGYADGGIVTAPAAPASTTPSAAGGVPSVSFGDIVVNVPQGTDINNPTQFAQMVEATFGQVFDRKLAQAMRMRGPLNRGY